MELSKNFRQERSSCPDQAAYAKKLMAMKAQLESDINEKSENLMELQDSYPDS